ncbi:MAG: prealbumin-like fold domain-containing protein [Clostridiales bacterium]|nr:prealbumin-like fold domain-containing protein [Clostridiales bacterium]
MFSDDCTFEVVFENLNALYDTQTTPALISISSSSKIVIKYNSTLNDKANTGSTSNDNKVYLEYSNNPYASGTGTTPEKKVSVYTYVVSIHKVDSSGNPLNGADFTLYKYDSEVSTYVEVSVETTTSTEPGTSVIKTVESETYYATVTENGTEATTEVTVDDCKFTYTGLDAGTYMLKESSTPNGYNTSSDIYFTIVASHNGTGLAELYIKDADGNVISNYFS